MSGAIIIMNAARNAREQREKEEILRKELEKHDKEMREKGYYKQMVLKNPNSRYCHMYRNSAKQNSGTLFICLSAAIITSIAIMFLSLPSISVFWAIPFLVSSILFCVGLVRFYNVKYSWNGNKVPENLPGFYHISTDDSPKYDYEWVSKKRK